MTTPKVVSIILNPIKLMFGQSESDWERTVANFLADWGIMVVEPKLEMAIWKLVRKVRAEAVEEERQRWQKKVGNKDWHEQYLNSTRT